jgi:hypothetical protein
MGNIACLPIDLMILRLVLFKYILKVIGCGFEFEIPRSRNFKLKTSTERTPHPTPAFPATTAGGSEGEVYRFPTDSHNFYYTRYYSGGG